MELLGRVWRFLKLNDHKGISLKCWIYSAWYRYLVLYADAEKLQKRWGIEGEESLEEEAPDNYRYAKKVSYCVNQICDKTFWESKCLVRALTAQKLLKEKKISSTMYLGCRLEDEKMAAHAWIRCGRMYVTGGNGEGYAVVARFRN